MHDVFNFNVGDFQCLAVNDRNSAMRAALLFSDAPETELLQALERRGLEPDHLPSTRTCLLVDTGSKTVLVDTGGGELVGEKGGKLVPALRGAGYEPADIDVVFLSHIHSDHIGGCLEQDGALVYSEARYVMGQDEWAFWTEETNLAAAPDWMASPARRVLPRLSDRMSTVDADAEILPGIRAIAAPGHTAGHMALEVVSEGSRLIYLADAALHPIHVENPHWVSALDQFSEQVVQSRRALFKRASEQQALVLAFHFPPFPSLGYIVEEGASWRWQPADTAP